MLKSANKSGFLKKIGDFGQQIGREFLDRRGYRVIASNYFGPEGEIDLVAQQGQQLVFIEVKTRLSTNYGWPEEAIDRKKITKLLKTVGHYLVEKEVADDNFRLDCLAVAIDRANLKAQIRHYKNIG
jgi:putative endonuclease